MDRKRCAGRCAGAACLAALAGWAAVADPAPQPPPVSTALFRRPVAAVLLDDGRTLCVANHRGSVSLVDLRQGKVRDELAVGRRLAGLAMLPDRKHLLVIDEEKHELVALSCDGARLAARTRLAVGPYPASVTVQLDGRRATVASVWSRRVQVIDLLPLSRGRRRAALRVLHTVPLPFAPREQCLLPGRSQVVVADAFGGHVAVVDAASGQLVTVHRLTGHNLRGLAVSADGKQLLLSHQVLNPRAPATPQNIERGVLLANVLRLIPLDSVLAPRADLDQVSRLIPLGEKGKGAGDPAGLAVLDTDQAAVALAGVQEVALVRLDGKSTRRVPVGRRPTAVLTGGQGQLLVVVNTFEDSLSLLDVRRGAVTQTISLGQCPEPGLRERGELLFYDARLSRDGWMSCHSCHTDGHTNGLPADTETDGTFGTPKRTLTLRGTALTDPWGWNGQFRYLRDQVEKSLADTMHAPAASWRQADALAAFLSTLPPPPPLSPPGEEDRERVERGRQVFERRGCVRCHVAPLTYTSHGVHDVGLADERGLRTFNPPSLRGVGQGYRFLHDGRAATLAEVFTKFRHKVGAGLPPDELADLLRFLRSL